MTTIARVKFFVTALGILALSVSGCDFLKTVKEYFSGDEAPDVVETAQEQKPAAVSAQSEGAAAPAQPPANILARVGTWTITPVEFQERLDALKELSPEYEVKDAQTKRLILDELINQQLLVMDAEKTGIANQKDVLLAVDEFRRTVIMREVVRKLTENLNVTEQEARAFYDENQDAMVGETKWRVREIVLSTKEEAATVLASILQGADFAQTAIERSKGKTAAEGGDLGFITTEPFEQMGKALVFMNPGDVSPVFDGPEGFYIVKLEEKTGGEKLPFEDVKEDIMQGQILMKQQQAVLDHLNTLKQQIPVEINEQSLQ